ncbi:hypothetical protein OC846_006598 [Tilletia horrida]|uniref:Uncharacterized protein n=1 Tax=Tilletia horrida TaxID=155126 RepID=A0AAN6JUX5_9BASI|nr:hypothetical protein OC846_006598 [Tilletia horrida]KAK0559985.1 hypothetical protein OC861_006455 [Tilletia horrida]
MTTLWSIWSLIPENDDLKAATADLIRNVARRCRIKFPRSSTLRDPDPRYRVESTWPRIFEALGLDPATASSRPPMVPSSMHKSVRWGRSTTSFGRSATSWTLDLHLLRAGHILTDFEHQSLVVL